MNSDVSQLTPEEIIPPHAFELYRVAIDGAARSAISAFLAYGDELKEGANEAEVARYLHDALSHSAAISRFFWPPKSAGRIGAYRGARLREIYGIADTSPLLNRELRNELEHFDEKIDAWFMSGPVGPVVASPVIADHSIADEGFGHAFKIVDPDNDMLVIFGRKFEFGSICREVAKLLSNERMEHRKQ